MSVDDDLLAAVYANPADDAPRLVYADYLIERGDARGELIALQCGRKRGTKAAEKVLLAKHGLAWLGPFRGRVLEREDGYAFARGFPSKIVLQGDGGACDGNAAWATIEVLDVLNASSAVTTLGRTSFASLRAVRGLYPGAYVPLAASGVTLPGVHEVAPVHLPDDVEILHRVFPDAKRIVVGSALSHTQLLAAYAVQPWLDELALEYSPSTLHDAVANAVALLAGGGRVATIDATSNLWALRFVRRGERCALSGRLQAKYVPRLGEALVAHPRRFAAIDLDIPALVDAIAIATAP
jgi:uncharacterized protein (TIGR02996 family)